MTGDAAARPELSIILASDAAPVRQLHEAGLVAQIDSAVEAGTGDDSGAAAAAAGRRHLEGFGDAE